MNTALLIDGDFFLKRYYRLQGSQSPREAAQGLHRMCRDHLNAPRHAPDEPPERISHLYRIFYYDCPPLTKKVHNPVSGELIDFSQSGLAAWRFNFIEELKRLRKVALRLGYLNERGGNWILEPDVLRRLLNREITVDELTERDVRYDIRQKGVDMRIGLDIASLAYKKQVDQIVLVAGDSDFVPAAKLARREGIDFILDPMWAPIRDDLFEHIDGLRSTLPRPQGTDNNAT
jgi:uncharacterized LabA/DUF88 family protein